MKTLSKKVVLLSLLLLLTPLSLQAGVFSAVSGFSMKEIKPTATYTVDTVGVNPRMYEFKSQTIPNTVCVIAFTTASSDSSSTFQMECIKTK